MQTDPFRSITFRMGLLQRVFSFLSNFIACKSWNPCPKLSTTRTSDNYSPYAQWVLRLMELDACAVGFGRWFVTERGKKKLKKRRESRNLNPGLTALVTKHECRKSTPRWNTHTFKPKIYMLQVNLFLRSMWSNLGQCGPCQPRSMHYSKINLLSSYSTFFTLLVC